MENVTVSKAKRKAFNKYYIEAIKEVNGIIKESYRQEGTYNSLLDAIKRAKELKETYQYYKEDLTSLLVYKEDSEELGALHELKIYE